MEYIRQYSHRHDTWILYAFNTPEAREAFLEHYKSKSSTPIDAETAFNLLSNIDYIGHITPYNCLPDDSILKGVNRELTTTAMNMLRDERNVQYIAPDITIINNPNLKKI